ncbi:SMI1/KNR4 family protein [Actinoallomurus liliacearum]
MAMPLDRLLQIVVPPSIAARHHRDWAAAEERLGRPLPQDYKDLIDVYGGGSFDGHVGLLAPPPTRVGSDLAEYNDGYMDDLTNLWAITENRPASLAGEGLLVVWADTIDADSLNWLVKPGQSPQDWAVAVLDADLGECELYPMTCAEFLAGLFSEEITSRILSHHLSSEGHTFRSYPLNQGQSFSPSSQR